MLKENTDPQVFKMTFLYKIINGLPYMHVHTQHPHTDYSRF